MVEYAGSDWVGFSPIVGSAVTLMGAEYSLGSAHALIVRLIGALLRVGVRAGDLTSDDDHPFAPWPLDESDVIARIDRELRGLDTLPDSGDICWFTSLV